MQEDIVKQEQIAVEMKNITMWFPKTIANKNVSFSVKQGEIFALVGENGAGKSTIMNVLFGMLTPTDGEVWIHGQKVRNFSPDNSISMGVGMVHQHFKLVPSFTVAQNIVLGKEPKKYGLFFDNKAAVALTEELVAKYGLQVDPNAKVCDISVGAQQRVEILKTLSRGADILILDEPTAVLTPIETDELFDVIRDLAHENGHTVIIITHKLGEVMAISDRVGVMRKGRMVGIENTCDVDTKKLASMMVGHDVLLGALDKTNTPGEAVYEVDNLYVTDNRGLPACKGISFTLHAGEILGMAGVEGNGQSELLDAITGNRRPAEGAVFFNGENVTNLSPGKLREMGLSYVPEDRLRTGLAKQATVAENLIMGKHRRREFSLFGIHMKNQPITKYSEKTVEDYDIRTAGVGAKITELSGGNMQKVVIAREFSFENTRVLIVAQPTRGVDVGAIEFIHDLIIKKRDEGCAILLVSADLDEVLRLSNRVITIFEGKITAELTGDDINKETVGMYMLSHKEEDNPSEGGKHGEEE